MIRKLVSGCQSGADRAALDAAIALKIPHGGWIPKGRLAEDGPIPDKYQLQEMPTKSYPARTRQNVLDSDGTVIFTHGKLTGGSKLTKDCAREFKKPWLHIDLNELPPHLAVSSIRAWIQKHGVHILNVAGSRASKDPGIYDDVYRIITGVIRTEVFKGQRETLGNEDDLGQLDLETLEFEDKPTHLPTTLNQAVDQILDDLTPDDKYAIAKMTEEEISDLQATLGLYLQDQLKKWYTVNQPLRLDCIAESGEFDLDETEAAKVIIKRIWERLRAR